MHIFKNYAVKNLFSQTRKRTDRGFGPEIHQYFKSSPSLAVTFLRDTITQVRRNRLIRAVSGSQYRTPLQTT